MTQNWRCPKLQRTEASAVKKKSNSHFEMAHVVLKLTSLGVQLPLLGSFAEDGLLTRIFRSDLLMTSRAGVYSAVVGFLKK